MEVVEDLRMDPVDPVMVGGYFVVEEGVLGPLVEEGPVVEVVVAVVYFELLPLRCQPQDQPHQPRELHHCWRLVRKDQGQHIPHPPRKDCLWVSVESVWRDSDRLEAQVDLPEVDWSVAVDIGLLVILPKNPQLQRPRLHHDVRRRLWRRLILVLMMNMLG